MTSSPVVSFLPTTTIKPSILDTDMPDDNPDRMDEDGSGRKSLPPGQSPANRERSASPRARVRHSRREEPRGWLYNPLMECVAHRSTECSVCREYSAHLNNAAMDDNQSYIDAVSKKNAYFVPITQWKVEVKKSADARDTFGYSHC